MLPYARRAGCRPAHAGSAVILPVFSRDLDSIVISIPRDELRNALFHWRARPETDRLLEIGNVGGRGSHVAGLHRHQVEDRLAAEALFEHLYVARELHRPAVADVEDAPGRIARRRVRAIAAPRRGGSSG